MGVGEEPIPIPEEEEEEMVEPTQTNKKKGKEVKVDPDEVFNTLDQAKAKLMRLEQ